MHNRDGENRGGDSLRQHALMCAKNFKTGWVELGRVLFTIWKDRAYRRWGYEKFETYVVKEVGIRKITALKLLRSYGYIEREEPDYLKEEYLSTQEASQVPSYESIDVLRRVKDNKTLAGPEYAKLKEKVFSKGVDSVVLRKDLTQLMKQREEITPEEAWQCKKETNIKRFLSTLKSLKRDLEDSKLLSVPLQKEMTALLKHLEEELK